MNDVQERRAHAAPEAVTDGTPGVARYRKRSPEVEAVQWTGRENCEQVFAFLGMEHPEDELDHGVIHFLAHEDTETATPGDWIIREADGEFSLCSATAFAAAYEPAEARALDHQAVVNVIDQYLGPLFISSEMATRICKLSGRGYA